MVADHISGLKAGWEMVENENNRPDGDLRAVLVFFWAISLLRVVLGLIHHETFGVEGSLALLTVLLLPWLLRGPSLRVGRAHGARRWRRTLDLLRKPNGKP